MLQLKNKPARGARLLKMNEDTYILRRKVIDILYAIKARRMYLPRVEIRIVTETQGAVAYAYPAGNVVHIDQRYMTKEYSQHLVFIVLHELVHAVFGVGEVVGCKLMHCSEVWENKPTTEEAWSIFRTYYDTYKSSL